MAESTHPTPHNAADVLHKRPNYFLVLLGLSALTAIEIAVAEIFPHTTPLVIVLVTLSIAKIVLVALFYMHLLSDSRWFSYIFLIPIPFIALVLLALLAAQLIASNTLNLGLQ